MKKIFSREFINFVNKSPSSYHAVRNCSDLLEENGFKRLFMNEKWDVKPGGKYFIKRTNSTLLAFTLPENVKAENGFRIVGSHTDFPSIKIKPNPEMKSGNLLRINTEIYGGPILSTWFDRPLSIAGRLVLKTDDIFKPKTMLIYIAKPLLTIPNLAIHQNRNVNQGVEIDRQNDMLPVLGVVKETLEKENFLLKLIADTWELEIENILDFDLFLYPYEKGTLLGLNNELVSAGRIDNLASVFTSINALIESKDTKSVSIVAAFDNEEIGSSTKQGADSNYLLHFLERIYLSLGMKREDFLLALGKSFLISADGAHAGHPAHMEKMDPTNSPQINNGVVLKISASQRYTSDAYSIGVIKQLVKKKNIKLQYFVNNSKEVGGSTIGPLSAKHLDIDSVDLGIPMLAMHSCRELCGIEDLFDLREIARLFYEA